MLHSSLLSVNPLDGARTFMHHDDVTGVIHFETAADVEALIEQNVAECNATEKHSRWGDGKRVACLPGFILTMLNRTNRGPVKNPVAFFKWLEEHPKFKVRAGDFRGLVKESSLVSQ